MYKLTEGSCPKSYGTNVARLAGLPASLVNRASLMAATLEKRALEEAEGHEKGITALKPLASKIERALRGASGTARDAGLRELQADARQLLTEFSH